MNIKPIRNDNDHKEAMQLIEAYWDAEPGTTQAEELDVLATLVEAYEEAKYPIEAPDPVEAIKFRMEQQGLTDKDLVSILGQRSRVSEILNKKRKLNISMIRKLHQKLNIPLKSLVSDYALTI
jgi:HTH-type transcriptional regulator/antitoxin HigA